MMRPNTRSRRGSTGSDAAWYNRRVGCCSLSTLVAFLLAANLAILCSGFLGGPHSPVREAGDNEAPPRSAAKAAAAARNMFGEREAMRRMSDPLADKSQQLAFDDESGSPFGDHVLKQRKALRAQEKERGVSGLEPRAVPRVSPKRPQHEVQQRVAEESKQISFEQRQRAIAALPGGDDHEALVEMEETQEQNIEEATPADSQPLEETPVESQGNADEEASANSNAAKAANHAPPKNGVVVADHHVDGDAERKIKMELRSEEPPAPRNDVFFPLSDKDLVQNHQAYCPCCGFSGAQFAAFNGRQKALCPTCFALERHRLGCAQFDAEMLHPFQERAHARALEVAKSQDADKGLSNVPEHLKKAAVLQRIRLLHFGPQASMASRLDAADRLVEHFQVDFLAHYAYKGDILRVDVQDIQFPDSSFDAVIIFHVIEHVQNDTLALAELSRVLKPGAHMLFEVPCVAGAAQTVSCADCKTDDERQARCGQRDHLRKYGCVDVEKRLLGASPFECHLPRFSAEAMQVLVPTGKNQQYVCENQK